MHPQGDYENESLMFIVKNRMIEGPQLFGDVVDLLNLPKLPNSGFLL